MSAPLSAVVLCAGKGTRMKSERTKVLHPLLGRPLCAWPLQRALDVRADVVVAVVGHQAEAVESAVRATFPDAPLRFALQKEQRGTGDAVRAARGALEGFQGRVLILYGDVPLLRAETLSALLAAHAQAGGLLSLVSCRLQDPTGYGRVVREGGRVTRIVAHKDARPAERATTAGNAGIYVLESRFLWDALDRHQLKTGRGQS